MNRGIAVFILGIAALLSACGGGNSGQTQGTREAAGGVVYGGVFKVNEVEDFRSLFPLNITEVTAHRITNQIYEGLVKFDQEDLTVEPCIAESWEVSEDAKTFTFTIREGVMFHDDPCFPEGKGRAVTAQDFEYCLRNLCTAMPENQLFWLFKDKVKGANAYRESTVNGSPLADGVSGIKVLDDRTLQIELERPYSGFLKILAQTGCWVYPKEAFEKYGVEMRVKCVGTGAFVAKTIKEGEAAILERNRSYWRKDEHGNQLPYLDAIKVSFVKEKKAELLAFRKGNLDMVFRLPLEMISDVVGELEDAKRGGNLPFELETTPALGIDYFGFNHTYDMFKDKRVRQAFNMAIDRETFVDYTLQGDGYPGNYGIVPLGFKGYEYDSLRGFKFDPEKARALMAEAGYPNGEGFPTIALQVNSGGSNNILVAQVIQKMLKENIGITVTLDILPMAQHYESVETGNAVFWRSAWLADYPDPENFINLMVGTHVPDDPHEKAYINSERYISARFDSLYEASFEALDEKDRYRLLRMADQQMIDDAAIIPLFYNEFTRLVHSNVRNFPQNSMEYRDLSEVYFKEDNF